MKAVFTPVLAAVLQPSAPGNGPAGAEEPDEPDQRGGRVGLACGGLTFGKMKVTDGVGKFTGISNVRDAMGHYANAEAHAGAEKSAAAFAAWRSGRDWPHATVGKPRRPG